MQSEIPIKILLADDDIDDRFFFEKAVKAIPIVTQLITVSNGEELMNYLHTNLMSLPDVLFLDLSMPRKTGFECLLEMNEDENLKDIPVVVFTTSFRRDLEFEQKLSNTLINMGAQSYLPKPSDFEKLKQILQQILIKILEKTRSITELKNKSIDTE